MRKTLFALVFVILLTSFISAEILINEQPKEFYNLGETITIPVKITTLVTLNTFFEMNLICNGIESIVHKEHIDLSAGGEEKLTPSIPLIESFIGRTTGTCTLKASLETGDIFVTNEFKISDIIEIRRLNEQEEFQPSENLIVEGEAIKDKKIIILLN